MTSLYESLRPPITPKSPWRVAYEIDGETGEYTVEAAYEPHSVAYFCSTCGSLWARLKVGGTWTIESIPCHRHSPTGVPDWSAWPGSILRHPGLTSRQISSMWLAVALDNLPPSLLLREFGLAMKEAENELTSA